MFASTRQPAVPDPIDFGIDPSARRAGSDRFRHRPVSPPCRIRSISASTRQFVSAPGITDRGHRTKRE
jgi:hypothetical protein